MTDINSLTVEQYQAWKADGITDRKILEKLYYSPDNSYTLQNWKKKHGLFNQKVKRGSRFNLTIHEFAKYKSRDVRNRDIAKKYGVSVGIVYRWVNLQKKKGVIPD